jgi:hypothetical protein
MVSNGSLRVRDFGEDDLEGVFFSMRLADRSLILALAALTAWVMSC